MTAAASPVERLHSLAHVVAFAIGKGGAGKTSLTANISVLLAESGFRVLVLTLDPQDNLGEDLGYTYEGSSDGGEALAGALLRDIPLTVPLRDVRPNLDVISSGRQAGEPLVVEMAGAGRPDDVLANALLPLAEEYDFILIDCPPFSRALQRQAFAAAQWLVVPSQADSSSTKGIAELAEEFVAVRDSANPELTFAGVVLFDVPEAAKSLRSRVTEELNEGLAGFSSVLRSSIRSAKAPAEAARKRGITMAELARDFVPGWQVLRGTAAKTGVPKSALGVASDYEALTVELMQIFGFEISDEEEQS